MATSPRFTFIVDLSVPIDVCFPDHLVHFLVGQLFAQVRHDVTQLCGADVAVAVLDKTPHAQSRTDRQKQADRRTFARRAVVNTAGAEKRFADSLKLSSLSNICGKRMKISKGVAVLQNPPPQKKKLHFWKKSRILDSFRMSGLNLVISKPTHNR